MPVYLVRLSKSRDIVGFFAAENLDELTIAVDEYIDVPAREYVELPVGGIMWSSPAGPVPFNVRDLEDEETEFPELPWASAELSESWWDVIYGYTDETWIAFDLGSATSSDARTTTTANGTGASRAAATTQRRRSRLNYFRFASLRPLGLGCLWSRATRV